MINKNLVKISIVLLFGFVFGFYVSKLNIMGNNKLLNTKDVQVRLNIPSYKYINPLLFSDSPKDQSREFSNLVNIIKSYIGDLQKSNVLRSASVYFRDLNTGYWTDINNSETYEPASLLKVVVMMAVLRLAEENPSILQREEYYSGLDDDGQYYKPRISLSIGKHTIRDLMESMLLDSDNGATASILQDDEVRNAFQKTYNIFRLPIVTSTSTTDYMSIKSYSTLFRILYNSSFFGWDTSEQALELLTKTKFDLGIIAGVPNNIIVAHKFGEYTKQGVNGNYQHELHDCGIVYYSNKPYLLCIMTKGNDFKSLESVISNISKIVYKMVSDSKI